MARKLGIDAFVVANAVMVSLLSEEALVPCFVVGDVIGVADHVIDAATIDYQPRARKLILTFDLSDPAEGEPMQSQGDLHDIELRDPQ